MASITKTVLRMICWTLLSVFTFDLCVSINGDLGNSGGGTGMMSDTQRQGNSDE